MNLSMKGFTDPFLRTTDGLERSPVIGLSPFDYLMQKGGPEFPRMMSVGGYENDHFKKYPNQRLAKGSAVSLDENHKLVHFWPGRGLRFVGFLNAQNADEGGVRVRGVVELPIEGVTEKHRGEKVFCSGPDLFHLDNRSGAACIGRVAHVREDKPGWANVFHKRFDDERPIDLTLNYR